MEPFPSKFCIVLQGFRSVIQGTYSQHFIFFVTYKWVQFDKVLDYNRMKRLARDKHSSLLGPFVSYKEVKVL